MRSAARLATALGVGLLASACREAPPAERPTAPLEPRATLMLEPPQLGVGQVATLELAVVTPPGHAPRPFTPPPEVAGLWILDVETLPPERQPARWLHRTRIRVRAREAGSFRWPGPSLEVEAPDGSLRELRSDALPIEVHSILPEYPDRLVPFGVRAPPALAPAPWAPAAAGALAALALVGLGALARRRLRATPQESASAPPPGAPPWQRARDDLADVRRLATNAPFPAAHALSLALRRYAARRFGAVTRSRTGPELARATPPFALTSRWPSLVGMLAALDELRFRPEQDAPTRDALATRLHALIDAAEAWIEDTLPPEDRS